MLLYSVSNGKRSNAPWKAPPTPAKVVVDNRSPATVKQRDTKLQQQKTPIFYATGVL